MRRLWWGMAAALILLVLYIPALGYDFLPGWDDGVYLLFNRHLALSRENIVHIFTVTFNHVYSPLSHFSLMLDHALGGFAPEVYRVHTLALFLLCVFLLYRTGRELGLTRAFALAGAMLWALNPQRVESVVWISERKDLLAGVFAFGAFWAFLRALKQDKVPWLAALLSVLAIFSKTSAIPLFGVFAVTAFAQGKLPDVRTAKRVLVLPCGAALLASGFSLWGSMQETGPGSFWLDWKLPLESLFSYPQELLFPVTRLLHPLPAARFALSGFLSFLLVSGTVFSLFWLLLAKKAGYSRMQIFASALIVLGIMVPVLGVPQLAVLSRCDRFNFFPAAALALMLMLTVQRLTAGHDTARRVFFGIAAIWCTAFFCWSIPVREQWRRERIFFHTMLNEPLPLPAAGMKAAALSGYLNHDGALMLKAADRVRQTAAFAGADEPLLRRAPAWELHAALLRRDRKSAEGLVHRTGGDFSLPEDYLRPIFFCDRAFALHSMGRTAEARIMAEAAVRDSRFAGAPYYRSRMLLALYRNDRQEALTSAMEARKIETGTASEAFFARIVNLLQSGRPMEDALAAADFFRNSTGSGGGN